MDFTNLKNLMDHLAETFNPGNAAIVYLDGKKVFEYACGYNDLQAGTPMTGEEMFNIYSCSKVALATAGAQMLERGRFLLTDPLYDYIPEFKEMHIKTESGELVKAQKPITVGDLFSMTAGFTYNTATEGFAKARQLTGGKMDTVETIKCMAADPLSFEPGARWQYSLCHDVLAALISVISGRKFRDYMKENIFDPLDMQETCYHHTSETLARTATQYSFIPEGSEDFDMVEAQKFGKARKGSFRDEGRETRPSLALGEEYDSGGAGIITTVADYAKFTAALANGGLGLTGERILSPYTIDLMRTNRLNEEQMKGFSWSQLSGCGYGLGVRTHINPAVSGSIANLGMFGWGGAAGASVIVDPRIKLGVFFAQHTLNPREEYYQPRLSNVVYSCLD